MFDHVEPNTDRITSYPGKVDALGDDKDMVVFRSAEVEESDPVMWPVLEHIEKHGLVLAEEITVDNPSMETGRTVLRWYMSHGYRRDAMPAPGELLEMWNLVNRTRRGSLKDRTEYGTAAVFSEAREVVGVLIREEYAELYNGGKEFMLLAKAEKLRKDLPEKFWEIIDDDDE